MGFRRTMKINFTWVLKNIGSMQVYEEEHSNMQEDVYKKFRGFALNAGGILKE